MTGDLTEGPRLVNPFDLLDAHGITTSMSAPRHDCRCGASFVIDPFADDAFAASGGHIREVMIAAAHAARAFLARADNIGAELPESARDLLVQVASDTGI